MFTTQTQARLKHDKNLGLREQRIYDFLSANPAGVLSTVDANSNPHGTVIYFDVDRDFYTYFLTKTETRKYDDLKHCDHVMLTVFEPASQSVVQITGIATEILNTTEVNRVAAAAQGASLKTSRSGLPPISKLPAGAYTAFKVWPVEIRMAVYYMPGHDSSGGFFESIESFDWQQNI